MQSATQQMELSPRRASTLTSARSAEKEQFEFPALFWLLLSQCRRRPRTAPSLARSEQRWLEPSLPSSTIVWMHERSASRDDGASSSVTRIWK